MYKSNIILPVRNMINLFLQDLKGSVLKFCNDAGEVEDAFLCFLFFLFSNSKSEDNIQPNQLIQSHPI